MQYTRTNIAMLLAMSFAVSACSPHPEGSVAAAKAKQSAMTAAESRVEAYQKCAGENPTEQLRDHCLKLTQH